MSLLDKIKGNPLEKIKVKDLRMEDIKLNNRVKQLNKSIDKCENEKKKLFKQGIGASNIRKRMIAQDMVGLDMEAKLNLQNFVRARKKLMWIKNLLIVKKHEKGLKNSGIWKKITSYNNEQLENYLVNLQLDGKDFDEIISELNKPFETMVGDLEGEEVNENEKKVYDAWDKVEAGSLEATDAERAFSIDQEPVREEEETYDPN